MPLVIENIHSVLSSRLEAIEGDTINSVTVEEVVDPLPNGNVSPKHGQFSITWGDEELVPEHDAPGNPPGVGLRQMFLIDCEVRDEDSASAWGLVAARYVSAVVDALATDGNWHTMGGYAIDTKVQGAQKKENGGVIVPVAVDYRVSEYDRTVQR